MPPWMTTLPRLGQPTDKGTQRETRIAAKRRALELQRRGRNRLSTWRSPSWLPSPDAASPHVAMVSDPMWLSMVSRLGLRACQSHWLIAAMWTVAS